MNETCSNRVVLMMLAFCINSTVMAQVAEVVPGQSINAAQASAQNAATNLGATLTQDTSLQDATIIALRTALGARGQVVAVRRGRFADDVRIHVEIYRGIRDATILANIQNRYASARSELLEPRLPESLAELVAVLEELI